MKKLLSFDEFVNEHYQIQEATDADGFDPQSTTGVDPTGPALKSISELLPGKEYVITVDGATNTDMIYQGVTDGVHIFNGEDKANDVQMTDVEIAAVIAKGGFVQVLEGISTEKKNFKLTRTSKSTINEGALAAKGAKEFDDINMEEMIDNAEDDYFRNYFQKICDTLGADPKLVIQVDSETNEEHPTSKKIYKYLDKLNMGDFSVSIDDEAGMGQQTNFNPKLNVVRADDYGFVAFYFTKDSKF